LPASFHVWCAPFIKQAGDKQIPMPKAVREKLQILVQQMQLLAERDNLNASEAELINSDSVSWRVMLPSSIVLSSVQPFVVRTKQELSY
jgi:hypothetical protein